ncbi:hypothetical protein MFRU_002g00860 [Monilinia fructicola]|uniref:Palmitoyltransferase PFA4 n=1 Tax=Monilinia fructicola TaxID=38448 RepID=A0A5M9K5K0_MONFR|nr:hypothetical protein EYC84_004598 [Monilinia fructicola]KAG4034733.1 hypothetical protein MFRU_002g00860 [Monilinia fructicola]
MAHTRLLSRCRIKSIADIAQPFCYFHMLFLTYGSQILFYYLEPGPLRRGEAVVFNACAWAMIWCYYQICHVDPGKKGWVDGVKIEGTESKKKVEGEGEGVDEMEWENVRWCKKCDALKPPRAHHCKKCKRCIPKMDHHCPWTNNCVSHTTFPHFIRFLFYAVLSITILSTYLYTRITYVVSESTLPSYLGPSTTAISFLFIISCSNGLSLFAMSLLFIRTAYSLATNIYMIEAWEIERHDAIIERSKTRNMRGYVYANGGRKVRVNKVEFPFDIGIWENIVQGMGTGNVLMWFNPFAGGPSIESAGKWEENGFNDKEGMWPPPDPDKLGRRAGCTGVETYPLEEKVFGSVEEEREAFRKRQEADLKRWKKRDSRDGDGYYEEENKDEAEEYVSEYEEGLDGEEGWTNSEGDRLRDYGVDEEADILDEDDIPLGELIRRRKARNFESA